jgi:serine/threonine-protein kinase
VLDKVLGEGAMGRVYLARHTRIEAKRFAIKVLHQQFAEHEEALARFKQEAEATALISSPHVVGVHDYGRTPDGRPFIVSDFLVGEELADRLQREGTLPVGEAVRIVRQICSGLAVAHANGVIHRDVKPENVFLVGADEDLTAKLLDFGISRFRKSSGPALTRVGTALGTPDFMSPEQARGKPVDHRADIYGVGVLLYVTLTGVMPFERDTPQETLLALLEAEAPAPRFVDPTIPEHLELIIQQAMAKEVDDRYPWIAQLSQALAPYDASQAVQPAAPAPGLAAAPAEISPTVPDAEGQEMAAARGWVIGAFALAAPAALLALLLAVIGVSSAASVEIGVGTWLIALLLLLLAFGPPLGLALRHVVKNVLGHSLHTLRLARMLRPPIVAAACAYAVTALLASLLQATAFDDAPWLLGSTLSAAAAAAAGVVALLVAKGRS